MQAITDYDLNAALSKIDCACCLLLKGEVPDVEICAKIRQAMKDIRSNCRTIVDEMKWESGEQDLQ